MAGFTTNLTLSEVALSGTDNAALLRINAHLPAQLTGIQDQLADRAVELHAAGNSRAISAAIFEAATDAADALAQLNALA